MEHKRMYYLEDLSNEDGTKWAHLLEYAFRHSDSVEFTVPMNEQQWSPRLKPLLPFLTERDHAPLVWSARTEEETHQLLKNGEEPFNEGICVSTASAFSQL